MRKQVFAPETEELFPGVIEGVIYTLIKTNFYNGEHWHYLKDLSGKAIYAPAVFFEDVP